MADSKDSRNPQLVNRLRAIARKVDRAPRVDDEVLWALVRGELSRADARFVYRLIHTSPDWYEAHTRIIVEDARQDR